MLRGHKWRVRSIGGRLTPVMVAIVGVGIERGLGRVGLSSVGRMAGSIVIG